MIGWLERLRAHTCTHTPFFCQGMSTCTDTYVNRDSPQSRMHGPCMSFGIPYLPCCVCWDTSGKWSQFSPANTDRAPIGCCGLYLAIVKLKKKKKTKLSAHSWGKEALQASIGVAGIGSVWHVLTPHKVLGAQKFSNVHTHTHTETNQSWLALFAN